MAWAGNVIGGRTRAVNVVLDVDRLAAFGIPILRSGRARHADVEIPRVASIVATPSRCYAPWPASRS